MRAALFFDIDGTLIDSYHGVREPTSAVVAELERLRAAGHLLFLSSGRPKVLIDESLRAMGFDGLVCINGGYVEVKGEVIHEERMGLDLARRTLSFVKGLGCEYEFVCADRNYTSPTSAGLIEFFREHSGEVFGFDFEEEDLLSEVIKFEVLLDADVTIQPVHN